MISFIVIGRNEEDNLRRCFRSIYSAVSQNNRIDYEIIYVDSNSSDNSIAVTKEFKEIKIFCITGYCNAAIARNIGAKESSGSLLFFIDGDMEIEKEFLSHVLDQNMSLIHDLVTGQVIDIVDGCPDTFRYSSTSTYNQLLPGGVFIIKRSCWESVDGMRTKFNTGEEPDLGYRLLKKGFLIKRIQETITRHYTYPEQGLKGKWKEILNRSAFNPRCVTYRDHIFNKYMYLGMWTLDKTFILLIISIFFMFIIPPIIPIIIIEKLEKNRNFMDLVVD